MAETKYDKYFITDFNKPVNTNPWAPKYQPGDKTSLLFLDDSIIKNAFYVECSWFWPAMTENKSLARDVKPHKHEYDEVLALIGSNTDNPKDLCGEVEFFMDGEKHIINQSTVVFLPAGIEHGPIRMVRIERPIFHFGCAMTKKQA
jgi:hypothetical protein